MMKDTDLRGGFPTRLAKSLALATALAAVAALAAAAATSRTTAKPANTSAPTIRGTTSEGSTLTVNNGNWSGTAPINYTYQWLRCDQNGGSCSNISGATQQTYVLKAVDNQNTLRARVTATNSEGAASQTTVPTGLVQAAPQAPATGCPKTDNGATVAVGDLSSPARLQIDQFQSSPAVIPGNFSNLSIRVHVMDTCGQVVSGASVYATAVPFNQINVPAEQQTGNDGWATLSFHRLTGFPAARQQRLLVMFLRARKPGESPLAGITTSRLVSFKVNLHGVG
jgi:hypothetical protein